MIKTKTTQRLDGAAQLGIQIRARRKRLGLTQANAAALCGVGNRFLSELENGKPTAHIGKVFAVLHGLGLDMQVTTRGQNIADHVTILEASRSNANSRWQQYVDELNRYEPAKLPILNLQLAQATQKLTQQVIDNHRTLSTDARRFAEQIVTARESTGKALKSAAAQIEELQDRFRRLASQAPNSDD